MKITIIGAGVAVLGISLVSSSRAVADDKAHDFYFQQQQQRFIVQPQNARMFAMGGSTRLTESNSLSVANNPAGLGMMKYGDMSESYSYNEISGKQFPNETKLKDKQNSGQVFGAVPINPVKNGLPDGGNFGMGWHGRYGNWSGDPDDTNSSTYQMSAAYGKAITDTFSIGYGLTYQNDELNSAQYDYRGSDNFLHTLGAQYQGVKDLVLGATLALGHGTHDLRYEQPTGTNQNVDQVSAAIGTGAEYRMGTTSLAAGVDYTYYHNNGNNDQNDDIAFGGDSTGHVMNARVGIEERVADWFSLRAGYRYGGNFNWQYKRDSLKDLDGNARYNAVSLGAGVQYAFDDDSVIRALQLDYGVEYRSLGYDDWQHLVTISTPFDLCL